MTRPGTMACVVKVEERVDALKIVECQCLDWHMHRVLCRHMLYVAHKFLEKQGVTTTSMEPLLFASRVRIGLAASPCPLRLMPTTVHFLVLLAFSRWWSSSRASLGQASAVPCLHVQSHPPVSLASTGTFGKAVDNRPVKARP